ncbi:hypothetical protein PR048_017308 [Dryococelus australis]|uniref:Uncharacterized protein n=1 Tax=Dryococelus australis TaxID=614101 RepID=A0ABQ9H978_9NEOP|nr:hypothetical protein PR048_017308 [Dryococelus australis]
MIEEVMTELCGANKLELFVLDAFHGHITDSQDTTTSLGCCVNKSFKDHLQSKYSERLTARVHETPPSGRIKKPTVMHLQRISVWHNIDSEVIVMGFKRCFVSNSLKGSNDILCINLRKCPVLIMQNQQMKAGTELKFKDVSSPVKCLE